MAKEVLIVEILPELNDLEYVIVNNGIVIIALPPDSSTS